MRLSLALSEKGIVECNPLAQALDAMAGDTAIDSMFGIHETLPNLACLVLPSCRRARLSRRKDE